jgi:spore maturation protein CgeB
MAMFTGDGYECKERISDRVILHPRVSYEEEMPKVFNLSGININLTKRSIETGVPLRVFDILGAGGFALTDSGEEVKELFEVGKELEVYSSIEEMLEKIAFYLKNDQLREKTAIRGYSRVKQDYTYPKALERMLSRLDV